MTNEYIKADMVNEGKANVGEITVKVNVDAEDFVKGMKAIQRLTRETTKDLRALEEAARDLGKQTVGSSLVIGDGFMRLGELSFYKDQNAYRHELFKRYVGELYGLVTKDDPGLAAPGFRLCNINTVIFNAIFDDNFPEKHGRRVVGKARGEGATTSIIAAANAAPGTLIVVTDSTEAYRGHTDVLEVYPAHQASQSLLGKDITDKTIVVDDDGHGAYVLPASKRTVRIAAE